ncbi:hypothetical protein Taro_054260 [Colocasia esculenta]|uniref:Uncharacterized protein n=1 Tax=Colocasia esculenta TaxID=4460 RepID=A0A843XN85_COLES|nr:hypothetical protein [Colocasia esculenta]
MIRPKTVSTLDQVVSTQCFKYKAKRSSSVDTSSSGVDTIDSSQNTFWPIWDSVSTLVQAAADTTGKKNSLVWGSPASPVAKNSSTRP